MTCVDQMYLIAKMKNKRFRSLDEDGIIKVGERLTGSGVLVLKQSPTNTNVQLLLHCSVANHILIEGTLYG
jgi:DNA-directed RNA polymerase beta subunit